MFRVMMDDLENYKQKAEMTKELATYFSPFSPLNQFSQDVLLKQPQTKDQIIDVRLGMKNKDAEKIKNLEQKLDGFKKMEKENDESKKAAKKFKDKSKEL